MVERKKVGRIKSGEGGGGFFFNCGKRPGKGPDHVPGFLSRSRGGGKRKSKGRSLDLKGQAETKKTDLGGEAKMSEGSKCFQAGAKEGQ